MAGPFCFSWIRLGKDKSVARSPLPSARMKELGMADFASFLSPNVVEGKPVEETNPPIQEGRWSRVCCL